MIKGDKYSDEYIFDYIEGNLSPEEKEQLEMQMLDDLELKAEVDMWKMTLVEEPLIALTDFEEKLIKVNKGKWWQFSLNSFFCIGLLLLFVPTSLIEEEVNTEDFTAIEGSRSFTGSNEGISPLSPSLPDAKEIRKSTKMVNSKSNSEKKVAIPQKVAEPQKVINDKSTLALMESKKVISGKVVFFTPTTISYRKKAKQIRVLTKKEKRTLNIKIRRDMERRLANKFKKGNVPYVVPLDISNF